MRSAADWATKMNIDGRLEALTHSVELLASMHKDSQKTVTELAHEAERVSTEVQELTKTVGQLSNTVGQLSNVVEQLSNIVGQVSRGMERLSNRHRRLEELVSEIAEGTARLLPGCQIHEQRIRGLEQRDF
ncbi:MAG: hypothetical protein JO159_01710 [Acidobacteria bacterium]|nr:hypothetical protein [Acidobacteriota bacterium]